MNKKTIEDISVNGKKVLVRCDFNVPQDEDGKITDNRRIVSSLETIKYLIDNNAKVILCSHLGRPKGKFDMKYSLKPVAEELSKLLGKEVKMAKDVVGEDAKKTINNMQEKDVVIIENVRFHSEEEENDKEFSKKLADLAEIYVNDAFGSAHRAHSSTTGIAEFLPAVSGFLMKKEIEFLSNTLENPQRPFIAILGGKKVSDKIGVIDNLLNKVDVLLIGGAMAYTFFKAKGYNIGKSLCELDKLELATELMKKAENKNVRLELPVDIHVAKEPDETSEDKIVNIDDIGDEWEGLDIGPKTIEKYQKELENAKTVIWNGPVGLFEVEKFAIGTREIARKLSEINAITVIGGGDSAAAIEQQGFAEKMTHISTGGGASLELLEGKKLPGLECLQNIE